MIRIDEQVIVLENKEMVGFAFVTDVCKSNQELTKYFCEDHPNLSSYQLAIRNNEPIYIVNFHDDMGQAGYFKKNLRKIK